MQQLFQDPHPHPLHHALAMSGFQRFGSASALPNLSFGGAAAAVKNEQGQPSLSRSSILSFGARPAAATMLSFSGGEDWPDVPVEGVPPERRSRSHLSTLEHVAAERKRREKMQQQFVALATMVPDLTKVNSEYAPESCQGNPNPTHKRVRSLDQSRYHHQQPYDQSR